jgi:hypothetical protein
MGCVTVRLLTAEQLAVAREYRDGMTPRKIAVDDKEAPAP